MKNFKIILITILFAGSFIACEDIELEDQGIILEVLPGYVAFNPPGSGITFADVNTDENGGTVSLNVENPTGTSSDITVTFSFSGSAVFGTDFTVPNSTATGGTLVIPHRLDPNNQGVTDNEDIDVTLLTDGVVDGSKTLTITLESAVNADGDTFAVGRGGTDLLKTANVNIADVD